MTVDELLRLLQENGLTQPDPLRPGPPAEVRAPSREEDALTAMKRWPALLAGGVSGDIPAAMKNLLFDRREGLTEPMTANWWAAKMGLPETPGDWLSEFLVGLVTPGGLVKGTAAGVAGGVRTITQVKNQLKALEKHNLNSPTLDKLIQALKDELDRLWSRKASDIPPEGNIHSPDPEESARAWRNAEAREVASSRAAPDYDMPPDNLASERATHFGYTIPSYHGTGTRFREFLPDAGDLGIHTTPRLETALKAARAKTPTPLVYDLLGKGTQPAILPDMGAWHDPLNWEWALKHVFKRATSGVPQGTMAASDYLKLKYPDFGVADDKVLEFMRHNPNFIQELTEQAAYAAAGTGLDWAQASRGALKSHGYDWVAYPNAVEGVGELSYMWTHPSQLRVKDAAFDPLHMYGGPEPRGDLMASLAAAGVLGGGLAASGDAEAAPPVPPGNEGRPVLKNPDGSISTEETITIEADGKYYLIPTIVKGVRVGPEAAVQLWRGGDNPAVGVYKSQKEADTEAVKRSKAIGRARR